MEQTRCTYTRNEERREKEEDCETTARTTMDAQRMKVGIIAPQSKTETAKSKSKTKASTSSPGYNPRTLGHLTWHPSSPRPINGGLNLAITTCKLLRLQMWARKAGQRQRRLTNADTANEPSPDSPEPAAQLLTTAPALICSDRR